MSRMFRNGAVTAAFVVASAVHQANAAGLGISPTLLSLSVTGASGTVEVRNRGTEPTRVQISVAGWSHMPDGEIILSPTEDIVAYPTLSTIAPGASLRIRVGPLRRASRTTEASYRLMIEELPSAVVDQKPGISVRTRLSVPVFLAPAKVSSTVRLATPRVSQKTIAVSLTNLGTVHVRYDNVRVKGYGPDGVVRLSETIPGWYLLAGETRTVNVALPAGFCSDAASVAIEVPVAGTVLKEQSPLARCDD